MLLGGLWHGAAWTFILLGLYQALLLIVYRPLERAVEGLRGPSRAVAWLIMFHLTCYGWLIFRASSLRKLGELTRSVFVDFAPSTIDVTGLLVPLLLYTTPLLVVHLVEARADDVLVVPRLRTAVRYSIYVATLYLIFLFGNFGGSDFIYFQF
jgi:alginate O-acetyltransferase complex protein AlgI